LTKKVSAMSLKNLVIDRANLSDIKPGIVAINVLI